MVKCLPEFEYLYVFLKNKTISKIRRSKVTDYAALMKVTSIAECSPWSILQYFCPALSDKPIGTRFLVFKRAAVLH